MSVVVVRYRPNDDRADENQQLVEAESAELAATDPGGVRYATFRLQDGGGTRHRRAGSHILHTDTRSRRILSGAENPT